MAVSKNDTDYIAYINDVQAKLASALEKCWDDDRFIRGIREGKRSVSPEAAETKLPDGRTLMEHHIEQRKVLIRVANAPKEQFISKPEMRQLLGGKRSPDEMDMLMMHEVLRIMRRVGGFSGIESLRYFS